MLSEYKVTESVVELQLGDEQVITVKGDVDVSNADEFSRALSRATERGGRVIVDLSMSGLLNSGAISNLVWARQRAENAGCDLILTGLSEDTKRVLQMSGLGPGFGLTLVKMGPDELARDRSELRRQDWRITESVILAEAALIAPLRVMAVAAAREAGLGAESIGDVRLAVTEALENALKHGSPRLGTSKIGLRCMACACAFVVEVTDEGPGVSAENLRSLEASGCDAGLGLRLMEKATDELEFLHDEHGGRVRMLKWIRDPSGCLTLF